MQNRASRLGCPVFFLLHKVLRFSDSARNYWIVIDKYQFSTHNSQLTILNSLYSIAFRILYSQAFIEISASFVN
jgi:hypothetical protein